MFYIYWFVGLLLAICFAVLMGAMYEIKIEDDKIADIIQERPTIQPQEVREVV